MPHSSPFGDNPTAVGAFPAHVPERDRFVAAPLLTRDARRVHLFAELVQTRDLAALGDRLRTLAGSVVVLRGEFRRTEAIIDTEERLFSFYRAAAQVADGCELILDCPAPGAEVGELRGIRYLLDDTERFHAILQAVFRASALGRVALLLPFVTTVEELAAVRWHMDRAMRRLLARGEAFDEGIELGIVVETPAAAINSRALAEEVDFLLVHADALARFALQASPQGETAMLWRDARPIVHRMVETVVGNAHAVGRMVGICGEAAWEQSEISHWLAMGTDALSLPAEQLSRVAHRLRSLRT